MRPRWTARATSACSGGSSCRSRGRARRRRRRRLLLQLERVPVHLDADHGRKLDPRVGRHRHADLAAGQPGAATPGRGHPLLDPARAVLRLPCNG